MTIEKPFGTPDDIKRVLELVTYMDMEVIPHFSGIDYHIVHDEASYQRYLESSEQLFRNLSAENRERFKLSMERMNRRSEIASAFYTPAEIQMWGWTKEAGKNIWKASRRVINRAKALNYDREQSITDVRLKSSQPSALLYFVFYPQK